MTIMKEPNPKALAAQERLKQSDLTPWITQYKKGGIWNEPNDGVDMGKPDIFDSLKSLGLTGQHNSFLEAGCGTGRLV